MRDIKTFKYENHDFLIVSSYVPERSVVYRIFVLYKKNIPVFEYRLGMTRAVLDLYNYKRQFEPAQFLMTLGVQYIQEMVKQRNFLHSSGVITSIEMAKKNLSWSCLEPLDLSMKYTR